MQSENAVSLSVIIPISERCDDLRKLYLQHAEALAASNYSYEFIFVLDGVNSAALEISKELKSEFPQLKVVTTNRRVGEATALAIGFEYAQGSTILTLAPHLQVEPAEISRVFQEFNGEEYDLIISRREPRIDSILNRIQSWVFHRLTRMLTKLPYHDVGCRLRIMKREVMEEVRLYGDLHRFLPFLAYQRGFSVVEVSVRQSGTDKKHRANRLGVCLKGALDLLTLFFLFKFTKRPLRFFGLLGSGLFGAGGLIAAVSVALQILGHETLVGRPLLVLGVLLMVMGVQLFSIGLLGEIIVFTHARRIKDYSVSKILE
ncbi:MAG: glycosyltransferase [Candidatus Poribacteria bacterium]|nr:glycosyltransferase [Candidatus Poribacteria bacterium]MDE0502696.1 glycosyltransferase [Candidatus Poribacteria bacterium]